MPPPSGGRAVSLSRQTAGPLARQLGIHFFDIFYGERRIEEVPPVVQAPFPLTVRIATLRDVEPVLARIESASACRVRRAFDASDASQFCLAAFAGGVAGFMCADLGEVDLAGFPVCRLPPGGAYLHNAYVVPELRSRKVSQVIARAMHLQLAERGCTFSCRLIDRRNTPSLIGTERGGIRFRWAPIVKLPRLGAFFVPPAPPALRRRHRAHEP